MRKRAFTLVELLVVISIIGILLALMLPAIQMAREAGRRSQCVNNLHQLATAVQSFHSTHRTLPTYNGVFPAAKSTLQTAAPRSIYGSWFVHLLPYVEEQKLYEQIASDVATYTNTGTKQSQPGGPVNAAGYWSPAPKVTTPAVPATYNQYTGSLQPITTTNGNGYTVTTMQWVPARNPDPGTGTSAVYDYTGCTWVPPTVANGYVGIWNPVIRKRSFSVLRCSSEDSAPDGMAYKGEWGATNYLGNWNAFTNGNATLGYTAPTTKFAKFTDGTSKTLLYGEGYAACEGRERTAFLAWHKGDGGFTAYGGVHNFGLTFGLSSSQEIDNGTGPVKVNSTNGFPNPSAKPYLIFTPQIRPSVSVTGQYGCTSLTVQTPHEVMNTAYADGSVRSVSGEIDREIWLTHLLPRDGRVVSSD